MEKYNCVWEQEVDKRKICVNINSEFCGKLCILRESECKFYKNKIDIQEENERYYKNNK